jgi:hypothetical protein
VLPHLLKAFLWMGQASVEPGTPSKAPWAWSCDDHELGAALEPVLRSNGVRAGVCTVGNATVEDVAIMNESWSYFLDSLMKKVGVGAETSAMEKTDAADGRSSAR